MKELITYTAKLASIIEKHRDVKSGEILEMSQGDKLQAIRILCDAFTHIIDNHLISDLYQKIEKQFEEHIENFSENEIDATLEFFDTFITFEEQLFKVKNIPEWMVKETLKSAGDIDHLIRQFMTDSEFRKTALNADEINRQISRIRQTVCQINSDEAWEEGQKIRSIIVSLIIGYLNTAADAVLATLIIFSLISSSACAVITWQKSHL